jgi:hypothetical protein
MIVLFRRTCCARGGLGNAKRGHSDNDTHRLFGTAASNLLAWLESLA